MQNIGKNSVVEMYNKSNRNDQYLSDIQHKIKDNGEKIDSLMIGKNEMKIQINMNLMTKVTNVRKQYLKLVTLKTNVDPVVANIFAKNLIIDELTSTNEIEGINTQRKSVRDLLNGDASNSTQEKSLVDHYLQIINNENFTLNDPKTIRTYYESFLKEYLSEEDIDDLGKLFRTSSVDVVTSTGKTIHRGIEGEEKIIKEITNLIQVLKNDEIEFFISVAIFHYYFGYIHPFYDGNGRINRLLTSLLLYSEIDLAALSLAKEINCNRKLYYKMFEDTNNPIAVGDVTYFVYNFISLIESAINNTIDSFNLIELQMKHANVKINQQNIKSKYGQEIVYLIYQGKINYSLITIKEIQSYLNITRVTALKYINQLCDTGIIEIETRAKKHVYRLNDKLLATIDQYVEQEMLKENHK